MVSEVYLAFSHPDSRAAATPLGSPDQPDRILLRDHIAETEIGAFQAERGVTQRLRFNVSVEVRLLEDPIDDDVDRILSYDKVTEAITAELAAERLSLLETLAERICERILAQPQALRIFIRIEKLDRGAGALGVEIVRERKDTQQAEIQEELAAPQLMYLSDKAIGAQHLSHWIDQLQSSSHPLIICVGTPNLPAPCTGHKWTQRRIDLLAIEQNAWVLASKDDRCVVVSTRTELDWAMKNQQICVWAPSKIVLDAVNAPPSQSCDALTLAIWFGELMEAGEMLVIGQDLPDQTSIRLKSANIDQNQL